MRAEWVETDVLVIGGGAAGCSAAQKAHALGADVLMVVKGKMGRSGATPLASGLAVTPPIAGSYGLLKGLKKLYSAIAEAVPLPVPPMYSKGLRRTLEFHYWLVDQDYFLDVALWLAKEFFPALESSGIYLVRDDEGAPVLPANGGYYLIHSHGMTGYQYGEAKRKEVLATDVKVMEESMAFTLLRGASGEVAGALVLDIVAGRLYAVTAKSTILATGHTNWLSKRATGTREMAANGLAMAARSGAELQNLEIQWYHASDMASPESWMRLHNYPNPLTGTTHQSVMVNADGEVYMRNEDFDSAIPYTIQMKHLAREVGRGKARYDGGNFTDYRTVEPDNLKKYQYHWEFYEKLGLDMSKDAFEVAPTWHMSAGGIRADLQTMATGVPRLYMAGAVGGHMLGGVPPAAYDGALAGGEAARSARRLGRPSIDGKQVDAEERRLDGFLAGSSRAKNLPGIAPIEVKKRIREVVWRHMMFEKSGEGLNQALGELSDIQEELVPGLRVDSTSTRYNTQLMDALDVQDMLDVCQLAAHASLTREESRGPHYRTDFPFTDNDNWLKQVVVRREDGQVKSRFEPVKQKYVWPRSGRLDYLADPDA